VLGYGFWWDEHGNFTEEDSHELGFTLALSRRLARSLGRRCLHFWLQKKDNYTTAPDTAFRASASNSHRDPPGQPHFRE